MDVRRHVADKVHRCYWQDDINCARTMLTILAGLGGQVIAQGTPVQIAATPVSYTGKFLEPVL